eukprot:scaffold31756_cov25-Prasinocladus_malaysianus.AAC.1
MNSIGGKTARTDQNCSRMAASPTPQNPPFPADPLIHLRPGERLGDNLPANPTALWPARPAATKLPPCRHRQRLRLCAGWPRIHPAARRSCPNVCSGGLCENPPWAFPWRSRRLLSRPLAWLPPHLARKQ